MADFEATWTRLMGQVNRPLTELDVLAEAKACINDSILQLQRNHAYHFTERLNQFTYPAAALTVKLEEVCEGLLRDIHSVQIVANEDANSGPILEYKTYNQIQALRRKYQRSHTNTSLAEEFDYICTEFGLETYTQRVNRFYVFKMGEEIGLYPTPTSEVNLLLNAHVWLPELVEPADTNFFLTYGLDVVVTMALKRLSIFMKEDNRYQMTNEEISAVASTLIAWDSQVAESPLTQLA